MKPDGERIFLAGATGVLGARLVPLRVADGHLVSWLRSKKTAKSIARPRLVACLSKAAERPGVDLVSFVARPRRQE
jgi:hypothetical protein